MRDLDEAIQGISVLIHEGRYLAANRSWISYLSENNIDDFQEIIQNHEKGQSIKDMIDRVKEIESAIQLDDVSDDWIYGITYFGITTHYKLSEESGGIIVRMEGTLDLPLFEQCATIHEVDLFREWLPFCSNSKTIEKLSPSELIAYICLSVPPIARDTLLRAYGADCLQEHGKVVVIGRSIDNWKDADVPFLEEGWFHKVPFHFWVQLLFQLFS